MKQKLTLIKLMWKNYLELDDNESITISKCALGTAKLYLKGEIMVKIFILK